MLMHEVRSVVQDVLHERFGDSIDVIDVRTSSDTDYDGDPVLIVKVIYRSASGKLDVKKTSGILRHVTSRLESLGETRFPLLSFATEADAKALDTEAA